MLMGYAVEGGLHIEERGHEGCRKDCRRLVTVPVWKEGQGAEWLPSQAG